MRAKEFIQNKKVYSVTLTTYEDVIEYMKSRDSMLRESLNISYSYLRNWRRASSTAFRLVESNLPVEQNNFLQKFISFDEYNSLSIKVGSKVAILNAEISGEQFDIWGFVEPKTITKIFYTDDEDTIKQFEFNNDPTDVWPRLENATYNNQYLSHSIFFGSKKSAEYALSMLLLSKPNDIVVKTHLNESYQPPSLDIGDKILKGKFKNSPAEIKGFKKDKHNQPVLKTNKGDVQLFKPRVVKLMAEGGWANPATQNTVITPALVEEVFRILHIFVDEFNQFLTNKNLPTVELGKPCGSTTYYKRDLVQDPEREYGDVDVNLFIPRIDGMTNNANSDLIKKNIQEFCEGSADFQTSNGTNVIVQVGNDFVQVDFITAYLHNREWTNVLAPEYRVKGVLCNSLYSSLGEALNVSMGGAHGVQAKFQNGKLVPFRTVKDVELKTITTNPKTWALDIAKFFGCTKLSPRLKAYPGMIGEIRVSDIINSIRGIAETLELNGKGNARELQSHIKNIYLGKIQKAIDSSKYDKAATPAAIEKAEHTKELLATKSQQFAKLFD